MTWPSFQLLNQYQKKLYSIPLWLNFWHKKINYNNHQPFKIVLKLVVPEWLEKLGQASGKFKYKGLFCIYIVLFVYGMENLQSHTTSMIIRVQESYDKQDWERNIFFMAHAHNNVINLQVIFACKQWIIIVFLTHTF